MGKDIQVKPVTPRLPSVKALTPVAVALLGVVLEAALLALFLRPHGYDQRKDYAQVLAGFAAGTAVLVQLFYTSRTLAATEKNVEQSRETALKKDELDREGQITERFTRAIEHLGSDAMAIRLGGIFALERIAGDSPKDHWTIVNLLTTYVKDHCFSELKREILLQNVRAKRNDKSTPPDQFWRLDQEEVELMHAGSSTHNDIRAILEVVGRRNISHDGPGGPGPINFAGITLHGFSFMGHCAT